MTAPSSHVSVVLRRAAEIIEQCGWCQGSYQSSDGRYCMSGAMQAAADSLHIFYWCEARDFVASTIPGCPHGGTTSWNDDPGRTKEEVIAALRSAADSLDEKGRP